MKKQLIDQKDRTGFYIKGITTIVAITKEPLGGVYHEIKYVEDEEKYFKDKEKYIDKISKQYITKLKKK